MDTKTHHCFYNSVRNERDVSVLLRPRDEMEKSSEGWDMLVPDLVYDVDDNIENVHFDTHANVRATPSQLQSRTTPRARDRDQSRSRSPDARVSHTGCLPNTLSAWELSRYARNVVNDSGAYVQKTELESR